MNIEMFVSLVIPDTVAITARKTLEKMGFSLQDIRRADYYVFESKEDLSSQLAEVDILVNANKHKVTFSLDKKEEEVCVLVTDIADSGAGVLHTLTERLGLSGVSSCVKGQLWRLSGVDVEDAKRIARELLCNEQYQEFRIL